MVSSIFGQVENTKSKTESESIKRLVGNKIVLGADAIVLYPSMSCRICKDIVRMVVSISKKQLDT